MEYIRVSNLRCIADSTRIELKPITLLVGANSSGKSSFLRIFPLIKQSLQYPSTGGLVLNEGEVNFGFFDDVLHRTANPKELRLEFGFGLNFANTLNTSWTSIGSEQTTMSFELAYRARAGEAHYARVSSIKFEICGGDTHDKVEISTTEEGVISELAVNGLRVEEQFKSLRLRIGRGMVPRLVLVVSKDTPPSEYDQRRDPIDVRLLREAATLFHGRTRQETRLALFRSVGLGSLETMLATIQNVGNSSWKSSVKTWETTTPRYVTIRNLLIARRLPELLDIAGNYLASLSNAVRYFAPVRARVERDYLSRDLPVTYVDPAGVNVANMLSSFHSEALLAFRRWMIGHFGFEVYPRTVADGARISLRLKEAGSGMELNLADTGFGFSQMLPFLVEIWSLSDGVAWKGRSGYGRATWPSRQGTLGPLIVIEQPELHLHPAMQAKLADFLVAMAKLGKSGNFAIRFVLETHSPILIERVGEAIENEVIGIGDVQVVLFDLDKEHPERNTTTIRKGTFDEHGILQNWPFGFLSADAPSVR